MNYLTLDTLFNELINTQNIFSRMEKKNNLAINLQENDKELILTANSSGYNKEEIKISYEDEILCIEAKKNTELPCNDYILQEFDQRKSAKRQIKIGQIDFKKAKAEYNEGMIVLTLPKIKTEKQELHLN